MPGLRTATKLDEIIENFNYLDEWEDRYRYLIELGRDYATATDRVARRAVDLFDEHVRERIQSEGGTAEAAERKLLELFNQLMEASGILVRHHFQRTLIRAARDLIEKRS